MITERNFFFREVIAWKSWLDTDTYISKVQSLLHLVLGVTNLHNDYGLCTI